MQLIFNSLLVVSFKNLCSAHLQGGTALILGKCNYVGLSALGFRYWVSSATTVSSKLFQSCLFFEQFTKSMVKFKTNKVLYTILSDTEFLIREGGAGGRNPLAFYSVSIAIPITQERERKASPTLREPVSQPSCREYSVLRSVSSRPKSNPLKNVYRSKQFLKMFIINGKSQASTERLAVGTGCIHQEIGYCLTSASCQVTCKINEDLKSCSARSLFDFPALLSFAYYCVVHHTWCFSSMNLLWSSFHRQKASSVWEVALVHRPHPHAHLMTCAYYCH